MDWLVNLQKAIDYIEEHLLEDSLVTGENISKQIFSSEYNFRTIFRVITGYAIGEYIRNRRLSLAGEEIINSKQSILDIALKYGYDTPESFTKAFTRFHGVSPSYVRKNGTGLKTFTRIILRVQAVGGSVLDYSIEELGEIHLIGYEKSFPGDDLEDNNKQIPHFVNACCEKDFDGICSYGIEGIFQDAVLGYRYDRDETLWYAFGVAGDTLDVSPPYVSKTIPAKKWIRFRCEEENIQNLWYRIFLEFMPFTSYRICTNETLEVSYCMNGRDELFLYLPLIEE